MRNRGMERRRYSGLADDALRTVVRGAENVDQMAGREHLHKLRFAGDQSGRFGTEPMWRELPTMMSP